MNDIRLGYGVNFLPLKAPVDSAGTAFATAWVDLKHQLRCTFLDFFGNIAAASADQPVIVTIEAATAAASGSEVAIAFKYRKTGVAGANTTGALTSATSTGITVGTTDDGSVYIIDIDPADLERQLADARFVRLVQGIDAGGTATLNSVIAILSPRYAQTTHLSAT